MHGLLQFVLAVATLASFSSAAPADKQPVSFTVTQVANEKYKPNGPAALAKAYAKYGKQLPENLASLVKGKSSDDDGSVTASPADSYDSEYLCPVDIGGQTVHLDFDTGSADLWVFSTSLPSSDQNGHSVYSPSKSSTYKKKSGYKWDISYGDGSSASGTVGTDDVTVGGTKVTGQAVELATKISSEFKQDKSDGLLGLAFSKINTVTPKAQNTFFDTAKDSLSKPLFTADLQYHAAGKYGFGELDSSAYSGSIHYTDVDNSQGFWGFTGTGYAVGSGSVQKLSIPTIADTGTTLLLVPDAVVKAYYKQVDGAKNDESQGGYVFDCSADLPDLTLAIGSYKAVIPGKYINYAPATGSTCYGGVQSNSGIGMSIYGDIFLKSQYVVFDGSDSPRLGFAKKASS